MHKAFLTEVYLTGFNISTSVFDGCELDIFEESYFTALEESHKKSQQFSKETFVFRLSAVIMLCLTLIQGD